MAMWVRGAALLILEQLGGPSQSQESSVCVWSSEPCAIQLRVRSVFVQLGVKSIFTHNRRAVSAQGHTAASSLKCSRFLPLKAAIDCGTQTCLWFLQGSRSVLQWLLGCKYTQGVVVERSALAVNSSCND